jgi:hypothetical protein
MGWAKSLVKKGKAEGREGEKLVLLEKVRGWWGCYSNTSISCSSLEEGPVLQVDGTTTAEGSARWADGHTGAEAGRRDPLAVPRQCLQRSFLFALGLQKGEAASSEEA